MSPPVTAGKVDTGTAFSLALYPTSKQTYPAFQMESSPCVPLFEQGGAQNEGRGKQGLFLFRLTNQVVHTLHLSVQEGWRSQRLGGCRGRFLMETAGVWRSSLTSSIPVAANLGDGRERKIGKVQTF